MIRQAVDRWLVNRLAPSDTWVLSQRNLYIVPNRAGLAFAGVLLLMLVASINYQLNLGYILTFLLAGSGLVSMHQTHGNLRGLTLHLRPAPPVFAGEPALLEVVLHNPGHQRHAVALKFRPDFGGDARRRDAGRVWTDVPAQGQASASLSFVPATRGWHAAPVLVVETLFPFGLFRAWTVWRPASRVLAWPQPERPAPQLPPASPVPGPTPVARRDGGSELDGVRAWRRGDSMRMVAWKKVAASGQMVSRDTAASGSRELWLDWSGTAAVDPEQRLSRLAAWVLAAERNGIAYGLRLPGRELAPSSGDGHRRATLDLLATYP